MYWTIDEATAHLDFRFPEAGISRADLLRLSLAGHLKAMAAFYGQCYSPTAEPRLSSDELEHLSSEDIAAVIQAAQEKTLTHMARGLYVLPPRIVEELALTGTVCVEYAYRKNEVIRPFETISIERVLFLQSEVVQVAEMMDAAKKGEVRDENRKRRAVERMRELRGQKVHAWLKQTAKEFGVSVSRVKQWRTEVACQDEALPPPCSMQGQVSSLYKSQSDPQSRGKARKR